MAVSPLETPLYLAHALFTVIYLLKRLSAGVFAVCRASPFSAAPVFSFFASIALPPWRTAFSQFAPVVNLGFPVLASGSNCAVKPTRLRRAAYFRSLGLMKVRIGLVVAFFVVALQWLVVAGFVSHSYMWFLKANDPIVTAGIIGTVIFSIGSILAIAFSLWAYGKLYQQGSNLMYLSQLLGLAGLAGLLVFFGLASVGYVLFVHR